MNEFEKFLGKRKQSVAIHFDDAKGIMERGFSYFVGEDYRWLFEYTKVVEWLEDNKGKGLMLFGSNGRGKSVICKYIIPTALAYYMPSLKVYSTRAVDLRYLQPDNNEYYTMKMADVICVDDFGVESVSNLFGEKRDIFSDIVDIAEHERKLLICSTNLVPEEITKRYGLRTIDRLKALTAPICFSGESMRGNNN